MNFFDFLTADNLVFLGVVIAIFVLFLTLCFSIIFIIIRAVFRFIKSLIRRKSEEYTMEGAPIDKGEDLGVYVEALEKSKEERTKIQRQKQLYSTIKYDQAAKKSEKGIQDDTKKEEVEKGQKDVETNLSKLKEPSAGTEKKSFLEKQLKTGHNWESVSKIKIPIAKRLSISKEMGDSVHKNKQDLKNQFYKNKQEDQVAVSGNLSTVLKNRSVSKIKIPIAKRLSISKEMGDSVHKNKQDLKNQFYKNKQEDQVAVSGNLSTVLKNRTEYLNNFDIKISKGTFSTDLEKFAKTQAQQREGKTLGQKDSSIFGGKQELTRSELREKLRDPSLDKIERSVGLDMTPVQRAKLEKELFPQIYGGNISKSDVRTRMNKLSQKMLSEKNPQFKADLRKKIAFFKKISGIK